MAQTETITFTANAFVLITGGTHQGLYGICEEINENMHYQTVNVNGEDHQITNEWINVEY